MNSPFTALITPFLSSERVCALLGSKTQHLAFFVPNDQDELFFVKFLHGSHED
jgi:hypothetical protein